MGQAIVYCSNCSAQLRGSDFDARKAFKVDDLNFCARCYQEVVGSAPPPPPPPASTKNKIPVPSKNSHSTSRIAIALPPQPAPGEGGNGMMYGALGAIGLAVVLVMFFMTSGGRERAIPTPPAPPPAPPIVIPTPAPSVSPKEAAAQQALAKALRTEKLEERRALLGEAVAQAAGTTLFNDAQRELNRVEEKLAQARAVAAAKTSPAPALVVPPPASAPPPPEPPTAPAPDRSREDAAAIAKWEAALTPATGRDYAAAIAALEKLGTAKADVALLKAVASLQQDATTALTRTTKGQKVAIEYRDGSGASRRIEASFIEAENGHVELRNDSAAIEVEVGEILPSSLADLHKSRGGAVDPATAAVFCLLEGDEIGAQRLGAGATVADRYWAYGRKAAAGDPARGLFAEAQALAAGYATAAEAVPKYQALLRDQAETPFVRRNKTSIAARSQQCARDFLFTSADLKGAGTFKALKSAKGFTGWTSEADSEPAKMKDNFVELSYSVLPDATYRCWVYAGACCQETFEFAAQGTEMKAGKEKEAVEPGSGAGATIKPWASSLKKTHSGHTGPKQPTHWEWVQVPLPKYAKAGLQQVRILTAQKGFTVAFACVTSTRASPPRELEMKELEKTRGAVPVALPGLRQIVLYQPAFDGNDQHLQGEFRDRALYAVPLFGMAFAGFEGGPGFTMPAQGEVRVTYFLKIATPFFVRIRIRRGEGKSDAYDAVISDPVAGRPTEIRLPFTAFKPMAGLPFPPLAAGDLAPMMYFVGQDPNCGLRIDGFSVVEFRTEAPAPPSKALYAENFDAGPGKFGEGEWADGGMRGTKAYVLPAKGISCWNAFSIPVKETTTISFKIKPIQDVPQVQVLVWSDKLNDNGRLIIDGLKKGEWKEVKFKATQLRIGPSGDGVSIDLIANIKIFQGNSAPDAKALFDDFEIRD